MQKLVRPLRSGQITIPIAMRQKLGIEEKTLLQLELINREIRMSPVEVSQKSPGSPWLSELYGLFDKPRKQAKKYSSQEIDKDIEKAVKSVRKK